MGFPGTRPNLLTRLLIIVLEHFLHIFYSKAGLKPSLKIDKTKILITNGSLMKVESVAVCSPWSILQYF